MTFYSQVHDFHTIRQKHYMFDTKFTKTSMFAKLFGGSPLWPGGNPLWSGGNLLLVRGKPPLVRGKPPLARGKYPLAHKLKLLCISWQTITFWSTYVQSYYFCAKISKHMPNFALPKHKRMKLHRIQRISLNFIGFQHYIGNNSKFKLRDNVLAQFR